MSHESFETINVNTRLQSLFSVPSIPVGKLTIFIPLQSRPEARIQAQVTKQQLIKFLQIPRTIQSSHLAMLPALFYLGTTHPILHTVSGNPIERTPIICFNTARYHSAPFNVLTQWNATQHH